MTYQFLEEIKLAARSDARKDEINAKTIAKLYGYSTSYIIKMIHSIRPEEKELVTND